MATTFPRRTGITSGWLGVYTWANRPPAASLGETITVSDLNNAVFQWTGALWQPLGPQDLRVDFVPGTGVTGTTEQILKQWAIPAGLLLSLRYMGVKVLFAKSGATDAVNQIRVRLGVLGSFSDPLITQNPLIPAGNRSGAIELLLFASASNQLRVASHQNALLAWPGGASSAAYPANLSVSDLGLPQILSASMQMAGTTDTPTVAHLIVTGY